MEENVALDTTKQKKFVKSIKGIKKLIKNNEIEKSEEAISPKPKDEKPKRKRPDRGLVYLSHIPHGFYEHEMTQYFKQFGMVTNARVIRSKRTGNSKGFAFVEFREPAVAEIVAETMNNYLMGKRLIKAVNIPPEKQRPKAMRKHWSTMHNPGKIARMEMKKAYNEDKSEGRELRRAKKIVSSINKTKKKLSEMGINYDFFTPVDVPEALQDLLQENELNDEMKENTVKAEKKSKKNKKAQDVDIKDTKESSTKNKLVKVENQVKPEKNKTVKLEVAKSNVKVEENANKSKKDKKDKEIQEPVNKKEQKKKKKQLKKAGVLNPPENFIIIPEESQDSDSSLEFDSDEYEKMLENDSTDESESDDGGDGDVPDEADKEQKMNNDKDDKSDENEVEDVPPPKKKKKGKKKGKSMPVADDAVPQKQGKKQKGEVPEQNKRKASQKPPVDAKKPKFEKQTQEPMKKQFKKKK